MTLMTPFHRSAGLLLLAGSLVSCARSRPPDAEPPETGPSLARDPRPEVDPSDFVDRIDNPYFPLEPGTVFRYANGDGRGTNVVTVTAERKTVMGIRATVVLDEEFSAGVPVESTYDWYAQDREGTVWYLGEDTREVERERVVSSAGSWEAGREGARPGILMLAHPVPGERYRQEYLEGEAEDMGRVLEVDVSATVPAGTWDDCIRTEDTTPLEPEVRETKVYCRGVGLVLEDEGPGSRNELVAVERH